MKFLRHFPPSAWKFAVFAVVCLVLLVALAVRIGNVSLFSSRHGISAEMNDVTGLTTGDGVDIAGVQVGQVSSITLQRGHALVGLDLNNDVTLRQGTDVGLRWHNVIGQKEVYLFPGRNGPTLKPGATLPLTHDVSDASVNAFLNSFGPFLSAINPKQANEFVENVSGALEGDTAEINQLINNGATVSKTVGDLDTQVGVVIDSLDQVLTALASRSGDLGSLVDNLQTVAQSLASHNQVLDSVVTNLGQVAGDLASLVGNNRSNLDSTINNLQAVAQDVAGHQQDLAQSLSTLGAGLTPYIQISSYGQWFQIQTVYTCLAGESACVYFQPTNAPSGSGPLGGLPLSSLAASAPAAGAAAPPAGASAPSSAAPSIGSILNNVAGSASPANIAGGGS
jgi:phospholipid/cholesterol/gamma-HCH transport system substrate-binding protein